MSGIVGCGKIWCIQSLLAILINSRLYFLDTIIKDSQSFQYGKCLSSSDNNNGERFILEKPVFIYALFGNLNLWYI